MTISITDPPPPLYETKRKVNAFWMCGWVLLQPFPDISDEIIDQTRPCRLFVVLFKLVIDRSRKLEKLPLNSETL